MRNFKELYLKQGLPLFHNLLGLKDSNARVYVPFISNKDEVRNFLYQELVKRQELFGWDLTEEELTESADNLLEELQYGNLIINAQKELLIWDPLEGEYVEWGEEAEINRYEVSKIAMWMVLQAKEADLN